MIDHLLVAAGEPKLTRSVSLRTAFAAGWALEKLYALLDRGDEPPMTRWVAHVMTTAHRFDISAANNDLGYVAVSRRSFASRRSAVSNPSLKRA